MASIYEREFRQISNRFYNVALDRAEKRDLFGATLLLKKSLSFNAKNVNARNLLALIFYEEGAITEAIVQWFASKDIFKNEVNPANEYLRKVQDDENTNNYFESVRLYNMAIDDIESDKNDLAMMKLNRAVELNDHNVKAMFLLSILYLKLQDHIKAGHYLLKCQKIDNGNVHINEHMDYVIKNTKKGEVKEKRIEKVYSFKKLESDDAILPRKYIKLSENQKVIFILIGIIIGALSNSLIMQPTSNGSSSLASENQVIR